MKIYGKKILLALFLLAGSSLGYASQSIVSKALFGTPVKNNTKKYAFVAWEGDYRGQQGYKRLKPGENKELSHTGDTIIIQIAEQEPWRIEKALKNYSSVTINNESLKDAVAKKKQGKKFGDKVTIETEDKVESTTGKLKKLARGATEVVIGFETPVKNELDTPIFVAWVGLGHKGEYTLIMPGATEYISHHGSTIRVEIIPNNKLTRIKKTLDKYKKLSIEPDGKSYELVVK